MTTKAEAIKQQAEQAQNLGRPNGQMPEVKGLYAKLAAVYSEIATVKQSGDNKHLKYQYSTDSDLYEAVRPLLVKHKLLLAPTVHGVEGDGQAAVVTIHFRWIDVDEATSVHTDSWVSAGKDNGGFAISKALTTGIRTYLAKFFQIPTGDIDPEAEHGAEGAQSSGPKLDGELVDEIISLARYLVDSKVWTKETLKKQLVAAGAKDTSSASAAVATLSPEDALALKVTLTQVADDEAAK